MIDAPQSVDPDSWMALAGRSDAGDVGWWKAFVPKLVAELERWLHEHINESTLRIILTCVHFLFREECRCSDRYRPPGDAWSFRFFTSRCYPNGEPMSVWDACQIDRKLALIAVDGEGIGHDIAAIARGAYA